MTIQHWTLPITVVSCSNFFKYWDNRASIQNLKPRTNFLTQHKFNMINFNDLSKSLARNLSEFDLKSWWIRWEAIILFFLPFIKIRLLSNVYTIQVIHHRTLGSIQTLFWSHWNCWKFKINCFYKSQRAKWKYTSTVGDLLKENWPQ